MEDIQSIKDLYTLLKKELCGKTGSISMNLNNINTNIKSTDIIGNSLQSWLSSWFDAHSIKYREPKNTQEFPDYIVELDSKEHFLEIKSYNFMRSPAFDLANFNSYIDSVSITPQKINADYIILAYRTIENGFVIEDIFLKKIWQLAGKAKNYPLKLQVKKGTVYNIRPRQFNKDTATLSKGGFNSPLEFINSLSETKKMFFNQGTLIKDIDKWEKSLIDNYNNLD